MSKKQTRDSCQFGNKKYGRLCFGELHLNDPGSLDADVTSGAMIQARDSRHYVSMDIDGAREGWTVNRCPGTYEIICADDVDPEKIGCVIEAKNGDITIGAPNGNVRIYGINIDIMAKNGTDNKTGVINIESNEAVNIETQKVDIKAKTGVKVFTPFTMELAANTTMKISTNFLDGLTAATSNLPSKVRQYSTKLYEDRSIYG